VLKQAPSDYLRSNIWITTSGMAWAPAIEFVRSVVGSDRVLYATDYPYQAEESEIRTQEQLQMTDAERRHFFETGAKRVFKLDF
jgi:5-carboxyvanillate decarboxylase